MRMRTLLLVTVALVGFAPLAAASEYLHPSLVSKAVTLRRLAVLPARVEVVKSTVKGSESMLKESEAVAGQVGPILKKVLRDLGFEVLEEPLRATDASSPGSTDERQATLARLKGRFETLEPQLLAKPKDVAKGRFSLGEEVAELVAETADAVVFVRGEGVVTTSSRAFLTGTRMGSLLVCHVIVVDAHTGDILFLAKVDAAPLSRDITVAGEDIEKPLSKSLRKLPVGQ